ncbi:MAG: hypothetical protein ACI3WS_01340 [Phascolarctobacterium sp.]
MRTQIEKLIADQNEILRAGLAKNLTNDQLNALCIAMIDGTADGYKRAMKAWFAAKGAQAKIDAGEDLTVLCDEWYAITRVPWDGGVEFYQPDVTASGVGTKYGDNVGMVMEPSTDTVAGQDDYAGHPLFAVVDCNAVMDPTTKDVKITAIDGITNNFERYNPYVYVGVLQQNGYTYTEDSGKTYKIGYTSEYKQGKTDISAPFGVRFTDNKFRQWTIHTKYMAHKTSDNKLTCCAGVVPTARVFSHNTLMTYARNIGTGYSATCASDLGFIQFMYFLMTGVLYSDGKLTGCFSWDARYPALKAETGAKRVLIAANVTSLPVGCTILIGPRGSGNVYDRYDAQATLSGGDGRKVTSVEQVTLDGTTYTAISFEGDAIDTVAAGTDDATTTYVRSWHWTTGTTDCVLGNTGAYKSCTSGIYPIKIQGIELANGAWETLGDSIMKYYQDSEGNYKFQRYTVADATKQSTAITADYKACGVEVDQPASSSWNYIVKMLFALGMFQPNVITGGGSSTYHKDAHYVLAATTGEREILCVGGLSAGVAGCGVSCSGCYASLGGTDWSIGGRLSLNGCRGELA